eukprot:1543399-Alexandrium_andersonii.AAC.1
MSASLVGSEMCIRDSLLTSRLHPPVARRTTSRAPLLRRRAADLLGLQAVSYTHLTLPTICSV